MQTHDSGRDARGHTWLKLAGLLAGGGAIVVAAAVVCVAGRGFGGPSMPVAGSGMGAPHTTYQQPVVDPINLGATTFPTTPSAQADPSGSDG